MKAVFDAIRDQTGRALNVGRIGKPDLRHLIDA